MEEVGVKGPEASQAPRGSGVEGVGRPVEGGLSFGH